MSEKFCCVINLAKKRKNSRGKLRDANLTFNLFSFPSNLSFILHDFFFVSKDFSQNTAKTGRKGISSVKRRLSCQKGRGGRAAELLLVREWELETKSQVQAQPLIVYGCRLFTFNCRPFETGFPEATKREGEKASDFAVKVPSEITQNL